MFPARAGMSRLAPGNSRVHAHVPRASGDEPIITERQLVRAKCSPRERG